MVDMKIYWFDKSKEKEWEDLPEDTKEFTRKNLTAMCEKMTTQVAIETLCHVLNEVIEKVEKLEAYVTDEKRARSDKTPGQARSRGKKEKISSGQKQD